MSDILWVQKPGNEFGPKMAFLDTLKQSYAIQGAAHQRYVFL
jgi:hypothetical protein